MIYVTSDLHGYPLKKFRDLLDSAGFAENDFLFVLGDVIDRGPEGAELLRWMAEQPNVQLILGNHEGMLLSCDFLFEAVTEESLSRMDGEKLELISAWYANGAAPTLAGLRKILKEEPDVLEGILDYLRDAPLYEWVETAAGKFLLVHAGLENFQPDKSPDEYTPEELLWARPDLHTRYPLGDATVIFGHTPTESFGTEYQGRMIRTDTWMCIDTGAADGGRPMLLRLDDLRTFY